MNILSNPAAQCLTDAPLRGIVAAVETPVFPDLQIGLPRLAPHLEWLLANGCDMVSLFGGSGAGPSFSVAERFAATADLVQAGVPALRLVPAVITTAVQDARDPLAGHPRRSGLVASDAAVGGPGPPVAAALVAKIEAAGYAVAKSEHP